MRIDRLSNRVQRYEKKRICASVNDKNAFFYKKVARKFGHVKKK